MYTRALAMMTHVQRLPLWPHVQMAWGIESLLLFQHAVHVLLFLQALPMYCTNPGS